jgi:hypothetical protein
METLSMEPEFTAPPSVLSLAEAPASGPAAGDERQQDVAALLRRLAIVARLLPLYDVGNDTVRDSLAGLLESLSLVLAREPRLELAIGAFEIRWQGRRVYADPSRESSLPFHLHRDGVRSLVFHRGLSADELARFLRIVGLGRADIPRSEDDTVTLLWEARLRSIEVVAVEGARPAEETSTGPGSGPLARPRSYLPEDADLPLPVEDGRASPEWLVIPDAALEALRREDDPRQAAHSLRLLDGFETALSDPAEKMRFSEVTRLYEELRDELLTVQSLPLLLGLVHRLRRLARTEVPWDAERHAQAVELILASGSDEAVHQLIHSTPAADPGLRPELVEFLDLVCPDPLSAATQALEVEDRPAARAVARQLVERYGRRYGAHLRQRFGSSHGRPAADLLRLLTRLQGAATPDFLARQCGHPDPEVREEACWHLERTAFESSAGQGLAVALRHTQGAHRRRLLALIERSRDRRFVLSLQQLLETDLPIDEAAEVAALIASLEGQAGLARWRRWLTPGGRFFRRRLPGSAKQQIAAAAAVAKVPGAEASHLLRQALPVASSEVQSWIERLLETRGELARMGRAS